MTTLTDNDADGNDASGDADRSDDGDVNNDFDDLG